MWERPRDTEKVPEMAESTTLNIFSNSKKYMLRGGASSYWRLPGKAQATRAMFVKFRSLPSLL